MCCRQIQQHKQGMAPLQQEHADAARRQKELDMKSHKLGDHLDKARQHADQWDNTTAKHSDSAPPALLLHAHLTLSSQYLECVGGRIAPRLLHSESVQHVPSVMWVYTRS